MGLPVTGLPLGACGFGGLGGAFGAPVIALFYTSTGTYSGAFTIGAVVIAVTLVLLMITYATAKKTKAEHWVAD